MRRRAVLGLASAMMIAGALGGCSHDASRSPGEPAFTRHSDAARDGRSAEASRSADRFAALQGRAPAAGAPFATGLAANTIDDTTLGAVRGGFDTGGVQFSFAFQEQTFIDHNLVQTIVVPTITLASNATGSAISTAPSPFGRMGNAMPTLVSAGSLRSSNGGAARLSGAALPLGLLGSTTTPSSPGGQGLTATTVVSNGAAHSQVTSLSPLVQGLVDSGLPPLVTGGAASVQNSGRTTVTSSLAGNGLTNLVTNTANNRLVQQTVNLHLGLSGVSQLIQQQAAAGVANRLATSNTVFR